MCPCSYSWETATNTSAAQVGQMAIATGFTGFEAPTALREGLAFLGPLANDERGDGAGDPSTERQDGNEDDGTAALVQDSERREDDA